MSWSSSSCGHSAVEVSSHLKSVQRCTTAGSIFNPKLIGFRWISIQKNMGFGQGMIIDQLIFCPYYLWESWFVNHESMIKDWLTMNELFLNHEFMINPWCFKMHQNATFSSDARDGHSEPSCSMCSLRLHMLLQWRGSPKHVSANIHQDGRLVVGSRRSKWKTPMHPDFLCPPLHRLSVVDKPQS